jgi:hypothetical protein
MILSSPELGSNALNESYAEKVVMEPIQRHMHDCGNHEVRQKNKECLKIHYLQKGEAYI